MPNNCFLSSIFNLFSSPLVILNHDTPKTKSHWFSRWILSVCLTAYLTLSVCVYIQHCQKKYKAFLLNKNTQIPHMCVWNFNFFAFFISSSSSSSSLSSDYLLREVNNSFSIIKFSSLPFLCTFFSVNVFIKKWWDFFSWIKFRFLKAVKELLL